MSNIKNYKISSLGDRALTFEFSQSIDENINKKIIIFFHHLKNKKIFGIIDIIPAYSSISVLYDISTIRKKYDSAFLFIKNEIENEIKNCDWDKKLSYNKIEIPVCYDLSLGIDLEEVAQQKNISVDEIIQLHCNKIYRVYMIGFLPGFAYMGSVDEKIITHRKQQPKLKVLAGSVGIAGEQTGIYPFDSPGGWNIIGQTPYQLFNAKKQNPVLLDVGDEIKFIPINLTVFKKLKDSL